MPAALVEYGFHTSRDDVELLKTAAYKNKLAIATAKAIVCDYLHLPWEIEKRYSVRLTDTYKKDKAQEIVSQLKSIGVTAVIEEE